MPHTTSFEPLRSQRVQKKIENFETLLPSYALNK